MSRRRPLKHDGDLGLTLYGPTPATPKFRLDYTGRAATTTASVRSSAPFPMWAPYRREVRAEDHASSFDLAADAYDATRPSYPDGLFHLLESRTGPLVGKRVLDGGAGTGIASRQLIARGAQVVALDRGIEMLARARRGTRALPVVAADAAALPLQPGSLDMVCFAQSWHWVDQGAGAAEAARALGPSGWWAAWWSHHPWADSEEWFDRYYSLLEQRCPGLSRHQRDIGGFGRAVTSTGAFGPSSTT